jgi:hypothetical protein
MFIHVFDETLDLIAIQFIDEGVKCFHDSNSFDITISVFFLPNETLNTGLPSSLFTGRKPYITVRNPEMVTWAVESVIVEPPVPIVSCTRTIV